MRKFRGFHLLILAMFMLAVPAATLAQVRVGVSIRIGPPALPVYAQPICPGPGYIWTPGYWAYGPDGYYWVPGTWVLAPEPGLLWTPGYWGFDGGFYVWHRGYWGPHVGFYGGVHYGFGYDGVGYSGGYWRGRVFFYNRYVNHINIDVIHNVYNRPVFDRDRDNRVSFNGRGGIDRGPDRDEMRYDHERHWDPTPDQDRHRDDAAHDRGQWNSENHGHPGVFATSRPSGFNDRGAVRGDRGNDNRGDFNRPNDNRGRDNRGNDNRQNFNRGNDNRQNTNRGNDNHGRDNRGQVQKGHGNKNHPNKGDKKPGKPGEDRRGPGGRGHGRGR